MKHSLNFLTNECQNNKNLRFDNLSLNNNIKRNCSFAQSASNKIQNKIKISSKRSLIKSSGNQNHLCSNDVADSDFSKKQVVPKNRKNVVAVVSAAATSSVVGKKPSLVSSSSSSVLMSSSTHFDFNHFILPTGKQKRSKFKNLDCEKQNDKGEKEKKEKQKIQRQKLFKHHRPLSISVSNTVPGKNNQSTQRTLTLKIPPREHKSVTSSHLNHSTLHPRLVSSTVSFTKNYVKPPLKELNHELSYVSKFKGCGEGIFYSNFEN